MNLLSLVIALFILSTTLSMNVAAQTPVPPAATAVLALDWSPDGAQIARTFQNGTVEVINVASGAVVFSFNNGQSPAGAVAWSPDGARLAAGVGNKIFVWNMPSQQQLFVIEGHSDTVISIAWRPTDGGELATYSIEGSGPNLIFSNMQTGVSRLNSGLDQCMDIVWSNDTNYLLAASGLAIRRINVNNGQRESFSVEDSLLTEIGLSIALSPDLNRVATSTIFGDITVYDLTTRQLVNYFETSSQERMHSVGWNADGTLLASADDVGVLRIWDTVTNSEREVIQTNAGRLFAVDWSPTSNQLAYGGNTGVMQIVTPSHLSPTVTPTLTRTNTPTPIPPTPLHRIDAGGSGGTFSTQKCCSR